MQIDVKKGGVFYHYDLSLSGGDKKELVATITGKQIVLGLIVKAIDRWVYNALIEIEGVTIGVPIAADLHTLINRLEGLYGAKIKNDLQSKNPKNQCTSVPKDYENTTLQTSTTFPNLKPYLGGGINFQYEHTMDVEAAIASILNSKGCKDVQMALSDNSQDTSIGGLEARQQEEIHKEWAVKYVNFMNQLHE